MTGIDHNDKKDAVNAASQPVDESQVKNQSNGPGNYTICCLSESSGNAECVSRCGRSSNGCITLELKHQAGSRTKPI